MPLFPNAPNPPDVLYRKILNGIGKEGKTHVFLFVFFQSAASQFYQNHSAARHLRRLIMIFFFSPPPQLQFTSSDPDLKRITHSNCPRLVC